MAELKELIAYENGYKKRDAEIVRCKDCDYYTPSEKRCWNERITADGIIEPDWFCADGKRKDG